LVKVKKGETVLWEGTAQNSNGQFTRYKLGNGTENCKHLQQPWRINQHRNDLKYGRSESFLYDELDRLTDAYLNSTLQ
jgi:hypothetical protein